MADASKNEQPQLSKVPQLVPVVDVKQHQNDFDSVVVILSGAVDGADTFPGQQTAVAAQKVDKQVGQVVTVHVTPDVPGHRLIISPTGPTNRDYDDIRRWSDAARAGIQRAKQAGSEKPLLFLPSKPTSEEYSHILDVALLGALTELYVPLQAREAENGKAVPEVVKTIGFHAHWLSEKQLHCVAKQIRALEAGRRLARDLGDPDPECMCPVNFTEYVQRAFKDVPQVTVTVKAFTVQLEQEYPLLMAVARASRPVARHQPRVIRLEYKPKGKVERTLYFAGKGVTYDTGGHDIKTGGIMAGMSRDKCGASNVAGFVLTTALLAPESVRVVAELGVVRNSVDSEGYVADEVIVGHSGARVKIVNTDAEGRLVLADCLSHLREEALQDNAPEKNFFSVATLTGHAVRSFGQYTAVVDNGPARNKQVGPKLAAEGQLWGDCFEVSQIRREDVNSIKKSNQPSFDVLQAGGPIRGHQIATAFLITASGLEKHGRDSATPLNYSHLDIAGSAVENCDFQFGATTACTIVALAATYVLPELAKSSPQ